MNIDFSPEKSLFNLSVVRWCAGISAIFAIIVTFAIVYSLRNLPFDFTASGFNYFAELYKVPATLLAIGFTLVGLCAANHRSEQTKRQIERTSLQIDLTNNQIKLTKEQNIFANHYKHLEEFEKYCLSILSQKTERHQSLLKHYTEGPSSLKALSGFIKIDPHVSLESRRSLYKLIFPKSSEGNFNISEEYIHKIEILIINLIDSFKEFSIPGNFPNGKKISQAVEKISEIIEILLETGRITDVSRWGDMNFFTDEKNIAVPQDNIGAYLLEASTYVQVIDEILSFDTTYSPRPFSRWMISIDKDKIPKIPLSLEKACDVSEFDAIFPTTSGK